MLRLIVVSVTYCNLVNDRKNHQAFNTPANQTNHFLTQRESTTAAAADCLESHFMRLKMAKLFTSIANSKVYNCQFVKS